MLVVPDVGILLWGTTSGVVLVMSALFAMAVRLRRKSTMTPADRLT